MLNWCTTTLHNIAEYWMLCKINVKYVYAWRSAVYCNQVPMVDDEFDKIIIVIVLINETETDVYKKCTFYYVTKFWVMVVVV